MTAKKKEVEKNVAPAVKAKEVVKPAVKKEAPKKEASKPVVKKAEPKKGKKKEEAPKVVEEKSPEVVAVFVEVPGEVCDYISKSKAENVPDAELFLKAYDPNETSCQECLKDFAETAEACKVNTDLAKSLAKAPTKSKKGAKKSAKVGGKRSKERSLLGSGIGSGGAKLDAMLLRKEGASMEELKAVRGAISEHFTFIKANGHKLEKKDGRYYATV